MPLDHAPSSEAGDSSTRRLQADQGWVARQFERAPAMITPKRANPGTEQPSVHAPHALAEDRRASSLGDEGLLGRHRRKLPERAGQPGTENTALGSLSLNWKDADVKEVFAQARDAQQGSMPAAQDLVTSLKRIKSEGKLEDLGSQLQQFGLGEVKRGPDGKVSEIVFSRPLSNLWLKDVDVDIAGDKFNGLSRTDLSRKVTEQANVFIESRVYEPRRPLGKDEQPMNRREKAVLTALEQSLAGGDLARMKAVVARFSGNQALWTRMSEELARDGFQTKLAGQTLPDGRFGVVLSQDRSAGLLLTKPAPGQIEADTKPMFDRISQTESAHVLDMIKAKRWALTSATGPDAMTRW